jgi:flagellar basal-body rod protein FlgG
MLEGLRTAAAGMQAMQQKLDGVANDLANANTNGYKQVRMGFEDLLYEQAGRGSAAGVMRGTGALAVETGRNFEQGSLKSTGDPLDVAISGEGFMKVKLSDGRQALTRDGDLQIDGKGRLATQQGSLLQPTVTIPAGVTQDQISIQKDGTVLAAGKQIGKIQLVTVRSTAGLLSAGGNNAFVTTAASGNATAAPASSTLTQGSLEASNTDMGQAMVDMIDAQRTYQLTSKAIQTADSMMEIANGVKR